MRDLIFISHATADMDNQFSIWLASRLEMLGYKVWLDKNCLIGGEIFWNDIQKAIQNACKVLLVYSKNILNNDLNLRQGIDNEVQYAKKQADRFNLKDFIIPLNIDDSDCDLSIGFPNIIQIPFYKDWGDGLNQLNKKLTEDKVPTSDKRESSFIEWFNTYTSNIQIEQKPQIYFSSWWTFQKIPENFYIFRFNTKLEAEKAKMLNRGFPIAIINNSAITFEPKLNLEIFNEDNILNNTINQPTTYKISIASLNPSIREKGDYPSEIEKINAFKKLLLTIWSKIMINGGMSIYEMSNKRLAFFKPIENIKHPNPQIAFDDFLNEGQTGKKRKSITGKHLEYFWHFALSANVCLEPVIGYNIKYHIIFSDDGVNPIKNQEKQHSLRRKKGAKMFNKEWRDSLRAFIKALANKYDKIGCFVGYVTLPEGPENNDFEDEMYLELQSVPTIFSADFDYNDPVDVEEEYSIESVEEDINDDKFDQND